MPVAASTPCCAKIKEASGPFIPYFLFPCWPSVVFWHLLREWGLAACTEAPVASLVLSPALLQPPSRDGESDYLPSDSDEETDSEVSSNDIENNDAVRVDFTVGVDPHSHGKCVEFVKKYGLPFLMVGGGGYTIRNVSRCWTYETSVALGVEIANELPYNDYFEYFGPDFKLHISPSNMANQNTPEYLEKINWGHGGCVVRLFASHRGEPGSIPGQFTPDFYKWELCRMMQLVSGFSFGSPVSPALSFRRCSILASLYPHWL
ncbi:hypothetical protein PR048_021490 [Dryococelus australis]|uniref:Histone deacetylase domain-containing protein n=1 Tax=Dryococelus australis TaxID=614101 RepID=A0ABQ9GYE1_9NEOP|nr:hypothetical protein PR048_021490 [Dryococelus australis]